MALVFGQMPRNAVVKAGDVLNGVFGPDADGDDVNHGQDESRSIGGTLGSNTFPFA